MARLWKFLIEGDVGAFNGYRRRNPDVEIHLQESELPEETDLSGINLSGADLSGSSLRGVILRGANLKGVNLSNCKLCGSDLRGASVDAGTKLERACLMGAWFTDGLSGKQLDEAFLTCPSMLMRERHRKENFVDGYDLFGEIMLQGAWELVLINYLRIRIGLPIIQH